MRKKVLFGVDYTDSELIKLVLYLFVGGTAALVEWALFYIFITYILNGLGLGLTALTMTATYVPRQHGSWPFFIKGSQHNQHSPLQWRRSAALGHYLSSSGQMRFLRR